MKTFDALVELADMLVDAIDTCDILCGSGEENTFRADCYRKIRENLSDCYSFADKAKTSFSYEGIYDSDDAE